ncbi:MAG TPA: aldo/keto reductase [Nakamurella sp.]|nr:aldo/keto reductase [Nakamurella sp.]
MTGLTVPNVRLNNGVEIPQLGFGVFQIKPADTVEAVTTALEVGYRHIDTAEMYRNEKEVGEAIAKSGIDPSEIFVTSKLNNNKHDVDDALAAFDQTLADLRLDRIDLFLIHWPLPKVGDFVQTWKALERVYSEGRARSIGVSNFQPHHLRRLHQETTVIPAVNQIELHPYLTQDELRAFDAEHGIATEAWSPIARGGVLEDATITDLANRYGKTSAQVVLRWHIQLGNIVFPKSVKQARMRENFEIFDFELTDTDMALISALNKDQRTGPNPDEMNWVPSS